MGWVGGEDTWVARGGGGESLMRNYNQTKGLVWRY